MTRLTCALLCLPLAAGCLEQGFSNVDGAGNGDGPRIEVSPNFIDFGMLGADDEPVLESFTVKSVGQTDLEVSGMEMAGSGAASFTFMTEELAFTLPPGAEAEIDVAFSAMGVAQLGNAVVSSDDPDSGLTIVELYGEGQVPELQITPDPLDMGTHGIGCEVDNTLALENIGTDSLTISSISHGGDDFVLSDANTLPLELAPGEWTTVDLTFTPSSTEQSDGELSVTSTEPLGTRTADQYGSGTTGGERVETWEIPIDPPADILFSLDQSCSMTWDIIELYSNFDAFVNELKNFTDDWQVIVANTDNGCMATKVITPDDDYVQDFTDAMFSWGSGDYTEALLTINYNAVHATDSGECNDDFMRPDAMLHIIDITDEPEQSTETWDTLTQGIVDKKGSLALTKISAIAGDVPNGCDDASAGTGYAEAVEYTGGEFISICQDWANTTNLGLLAAATVTQDRFQLSGTPVESSIVVKVNDEVRTKWNYESTSNAVVFYEKAPSEGDFIEISYDSLGGDCD